MKATYPVLLACLGCLGSLSRAAEPRPNIILILADDIGAKELSCYGNKEYRTPNLDRMAAEGVRFETFYAMPLCTPTRVAVMTGQYGFHNGFLGMQNPAFKPAPDSPQAQIGNHFTHADLLKSRGYATALVGKWQLSGKLPTLIHDAGFDEYRMWAYDYNLPPGIHHPAHEGNGNAARYWHPCILENGKYMPTKPEDFGPDLFNEFVLDFARRHKQQPFFVYYTSVLTHGPRVKTPDPDHPGQRWPAGLKSNLEYLDYLMGKLFAGLKDAGLDDNTLVIFVGDNGTAGSGKNQVTELGARVPCIIRGPGVQRGVVSPALGDLTDFMPTLAEFSGATLPKDVIFDGHSLAPVLRGQKAKHRDWIYSHLDDGRVLRDSRWLLEIERGGKGERFFDCGDSRDGTGYKDVTGSTDPEVKAARARFAKILASMPVPKPRPDAAPSDPARPR
jgi:arylsulfatase A